MPNDSDWFWFVETSVPQTLTVHQNDTEEICVLYDAEGNIIQKFTNSTQVPLGFRLIKTQSSAQRNRQNKG